MQLGFLRADLMKVNLANVPTMVTATTVRTYVIQMATRYISLIVVIWTWRGSRRSPYSLKARPPRAFSFLPESTHHKICIYALNFLLPSCQYMTAQILCIHTVFARSYI